MSKTVTVEELQAHPMKMLEDVASTNEEVLVTKDGKPLARVVPVGPPRTKSLEEMRAEGVEIHGDIVEPITEWEMSK